MGKNGLQQCHFLPHPYPTSALAPSSSHLSAYSWASWSPWSDCAPQDDEDCGRSGRLRPTSARTRECLDRAGDVVGNLTLCIHEGGGRGNVGNVDIRVCPCNGGNKSRPYFSALKSHRKQEGEED